MRRIVKVVTPRADSIYDRRYRFGYPSGYRKSYFFLSRAVKKVAGEKCDIAKKKKKEEEEKKRWHE